MEELSKLMDEEIRSEIKNLAQLNPGSEEHATAVESLAKLYKLRADQTKAELECNEKRSQLQAEGVRSEREYLLKREQLNHDIETATKDDISKQDQLREQKIDHYIRLGVETAGLILPLMFYGTWMRRGFKFEETGTYTSTTFRGLFNRFRPTKK